MASQGVLRLSGLVLRLLIAANILFGLLVLGMLAASFVAERQLFSMLQAGHSGPSVIAGMRVMMVVGLLCIPLTHLVLRRLLDIVRSVALGDAFRAANAGRLRTIAWAVPGLQVLNLGVGVTEALASRPGDPLDVGWSFSATGWLAVLLLFVLASVFEQGARMRKDLEGTV